MLTHILGFCMLLHVEAYSEEMQLITAHSAELHFQRVAPQYWQHRLKAAKALGIDTVSTYLFWGLHQVSPDKLDWSGQNDIVGFCRLAQAEGLKVILRPGPYICGEADFGGMPGWLLGDPNMQIRSGSLGFLKAVQRYFKAFGEQVAPLQSSRGGPIILVQVENEYDGYGSNDGYTQALCAALRSAGIEVPLFTSEMGWSMQPSAVPGLIRGVGMASEVDLHIKEIRRVYPEGPLFCSELYTGWFDAWGGRSSLGRSFDQVTNTLERLLARGAWFNLYMAHGGTSFGFTAGANDYPFRPNTTSYDYGGPIDEAGRPTPQFFAIRDVLRRRLPTGQALPDLPPPNPIITVPAVEFRERALLSQMLSTPIYSQRPLAMERLREGSTAHPQSTRANTTTNRPVVPVQTLNGHGCVWYRTRLAPGRAQELIVTAAHDYLLGWVGGKPLGIIDRSRGQHSLWLPERNESQTLDLLVEAMGHVNFGSSMGERKGITEKVELRDDLGRREVLDWQIFPVPLEPLDLAALRFEKLGAAPEPEPRENPQPAVYLSSFQLDKTGDTFLDLRSWSKGMVWVNGNNLGRYWGIGPQQTLYVPGPWLRVGRNEVLIVDLLGPKSAQVRGLSEPVLTELNLASDGRVHQRAGQTLHLEGTSPQYAGIWGPETSWQTRRFEPIRGRYVCFESLSSHPGDGFSTCAELVFLDASGRELPKTGWKVLYASSEESSQEDGGADRMFDGVPGTFWHSGWHPTKELPPHRVVVDFGRSQVVSGIQYLPRQDQANGRIRDFHLYASEKTFLVTE